jgi:hypothetical protein
VLLSDICRASKANGEPCKAPATGQHGYCWAHAPENAEQRRRIASRGGRAKVNKEVRALKMEVSEIIQRIDSGDLDRNNAAVMLQGYRVLKDLVELDRRIHETEEVAREVEELREALESRKGAREWGYGSS